LLIAGVTGSRILPLQIKNQKSKINNPQSAIVNPSRRSAVAAGQTHHPRA
jgi:hypothetical protein